MNNGSAPTPTSVRRSPDCDVSTAWTALCAAASPADLAQGNVPNAADLRVARAALREELSRHAATVRPRFSADGVVVMLAVESAWQIHPLLPQRYGRPGNVCRNQSFEV
jgi:hypothetical protein